MVADTTTDPSDEQSTMCAVCDNPCDTTVSMTEQSIKVGEYSWLCYDPDTDSDLAYLHR